MRFVATAGLLAWNLAQAQPSPAKLNGARFYPVEFVKKVQSGRFDPFEYWTAYPQWVAFVGPGRVELQYGEETIRCRFTATGQGTAYTLRLRCGEDTSEAEWTWLSGGGALTDLIDVPGGELARLDVPFDQIRSAHERAYEAKGLAALAGRWIDGKGGELVISSDGNVTLAGQTARAKLLECVHVQVEPMPRVPCLRWKDRAGKEIVFALLEGMFWVEGRIVRELFAEGRPFEGWLAGRVFRRPPKSVDGGG